MRRDVNTGQPAKQGLQNQKGVKDWTYFSRRTPASTTTQTTLTFFDSVASSQLDNIPSPNQFPTALYFHLHKIGFSILPATADTLSTANVYAGFLAIITTGVLRLKVVNETYFEIPLLRFKAFQPALAPDATVKMSSGNLISNDEFKLNKRIEFEKGASFSFGLDLNTGADLSTLFKMEARLSGFLLEYDPNLGR